MKFVNALQILGLRTRARRYGYAVKEFSVGNGQTVKYAQWLHPKESPKSVSAAVVAAYREFIREGDFCIDIGAHTGDSTLPVALAAGSTGCVLALEPNPYVFPVLEKNARANRGQLNIIPLLAAAAPEEGEMTFEYSDAGFCNGGRHEGISVWKHGHAFRLSVHCVNLERELETDFAAELPRLRFIKVDAEGFDLFVLRSIQRVIERYRPYVRAEVFKQTDRAYREQLLQFFLDRNYQVFHMVSESELRGERLSVADSQRWSHFDIFCVPG